MGHPSTRPVDELRSSRSGQVGHGAWGKKKTQRRGLEVRGQKSDDRGRRSLLTISKFEINKVFGDLESRLWERLSSRDFNDNKKGWALPTLFSKFEMFELYALCSMLYALYTTDHGPLTT